MALDPDQGVVCAQASKSGGRARSASFGLARRLPVTLAALPNKCSWTLLERLFLAIGKYGKPRAVRTDNEACFTSRLFCTLLKLTSIHHQRSELHCPWQNGCIERLFGTLKQKLDQWEVAGFNALNVSLAEFRFFYNRVRPRQNLAACRT